MLSTRIDTAVDETSHSAVAEKMFLLRRTELFEQLADDDLRQVATLLTTVMVSPGDRIITEGNLDRDVFFIKSGSMDVQSGTLQLDQMGPGTVFGELAAIDPAPRSVSVIAAEPGCVYRLSADRFLALLEERPEIVSALVTVLCRRLRRGLAQSQASATVFLTKSQLKIT